MRFTSSVASVTFDISTSFRYCDPMNADWSPISWQTKPLAQGVEYPDRELLRQILAELAELPPLVTSWEVESLKAQLAEAQQGRRFLLQGGDCGERFDDCRPDPIAGKLKILLKMSLILVFRAESAGDSRGAIRRPVCEAPLRGHRDPRRRDAAQLSRRSGQSARRSRPRPARPTRGWLLRGYGRRGADAELHPRPGRRRLRRPAPSRAVGHRFRATRRPVARLSGDRRVRWAARSASWRRSPARRSAN